MRGVLIFLASVLAPVLASGQAAAQALSPMTGQVRTYTDRFALQLKAFNPYATGQRFRVTFYDESGAAVNDVRSAAPVIYVPPGEEASFYVWGASTQRRQIHICVTSPYFLNGVGAQMRGEVCGKYDIVRLGQ